MQVPEIMDVKAHPGLGASSNAQQKGSQDCGPSDACSFHFMMPKISLKARELFLPFLKLLYIGLTAPAPPPTP